MIDISQQFAACYVCVPGNRPGERIGIVKLNESGYYAVPGYDDPRETLLDTKALVAALNKGLEVPEDVCESMFIGSMFGWSCPGAARAVGYWKSREVAGV